MIYTKSKGILSQTMEYFWQGVVRRRTSTISYVWFEKIWTWKFQWVRVIERIWDRTILVQSKVHTTQRLLYPFDYGGFIVEGYDIDTICSEEVNWNAVLLGKCSNENIADQTEPAVFFRKEAIVKWPHCHLQYHGEAEIFQGQQNMFAKVNWGANLKVISYGSKEKNEGLKPEKQLTYTWK